MNTFAFESTPDFDSLMENNIYARWQEFCTLFPTEEACLAELRARILEEHSHCRECGGDLKVAEDNDRVLECQSCKDTFWFTAGTFFENMRKARAWLGAVWLKERGIGFGASEFHKLAGIAYSSAWSLQQKISTVIRNCLEQECCEVLDSARFSTLFCKRSLETPAREHPKEEQTVVEANSKDRQNSKTARGSSESGDAHNRDSNKKESDSREAIKNLNPVEREIYEIITTEACGPDLLSDLTGHLAGTISVALTILELAGLVKRDMDGRFARSVSGNPKKSRMRENVMHDSTIGAFAYFVHNHFHGISRKYLQNYLAQFWCKADRTRWGEGSLLRACIRSNAVSYQEILDYVSPLKVLIFLVD